MFRIARAAIRAGVERWTSTVHLLFRQPGYLREARGFASPPRDGFAVIESTDTGDGVDRRQQGRRASGDRARGL